MRAQWWSNGGEGASDGGAGWRRLLFTLAIVASVGCGPPEEPREGVVSEGPPSATEAPAPADPGTAPSGPEPTDDPSSPIPGAEPEEQTGGEPAAPGQRRAPVPAAPGAGGVSAWCTPRPASLADEHAPELYDWIQAAAQTGCPLVAVHAEGDAVLGAGPWAIPSPTPAQACEGCVALEASFAVAWTMPTVDEPWGGFERSFQGRVQAHRRDDGWLVAELVYAQEMHNAERRLVRTFDEHGRLRAERTYFRITKHSDPSALVPKLWRELEQDFDAQGRLVSAVVVDHINQTGTTTFTWTWDAEGRMTGNAMQREGQAPRVTTFAYDAEGRLVSADRVHADDTLEQRWVYDADGALKSRRSAWTTYNGGLVSWHDDDADDHTPGHWIRWNQSRLWDDALPRPAGDCHLLPTSLSHGYPRAELVWELGWPASDRPGGVGFDYGYMGYAYGYGTMAWFGHGGVGVDLLGWGAASTELDYDAQGRLLEERAVTDSSGSPQGAGQSIRTRTHDAAGRITSDTLVIDAELLTTVTELQFSYDAWDLPATRDYFGDGQPLATHTWTRDEQGRVTAHGVSWHGASGVASVFYGQDFGHAWINDDTPEPTDEPPLRVTYWRKFDDEAGEEERLRQYAGAAPEFEELHRVEALPGGGTAREVHRHGMTRLELDAQGRRTFYGQAWTPGGDFDYAYAYTYDPGSEGPWLTSATTVGQASPGAGILTYDYECPALAP